MNESQEKYTLGIDVGSTTVKAVLLNSKGEVLYASYERHFSKVRETSESEVKKIRERFGNLEVKFAFTGSAGLGLSERSHLPFVQEVQSSYHQKDISDRIPLRGFCQIGYSGSFESRSL